MSNKVYKIGFFVLLLINIALVVLITSRPKPPSQPENMGQEISTKLGFTEEQEASFIELVKAHRAQMQALRKDEQKLLKAYFGGLSSKLSVDEGQALAEQVNLIQAKKLEVTYSHFEEVKTLCEDDQLAKFEQLMDNMMRVLIGENRRPK